MDGSASTLDLAVEGPAGILRARLLCPESPTRRAVVAHPHPLYGGTMDNAVVRVVAERLAAAGTATLCFDFRGVRGSGGVHDGGRGERLDLLAAERELAQRFPGLSHWLAGYSFGASTCVGRFDPGLEAARADAPAVHAVLLLAPPLAHRALSAAAAISARCALITGERDAMTPADATARLAARLADLRSQQVLPGAGHDLGTAAGPGAGALAAAVDAAIRDLDG